MGLVRTLVTVALTINTYFMAKHIKGKHNVIADLLSRCQVDKARMVAPWLDEEPTPFSPTSLPW